MSYEKLFCFTYEKLKKLINLAESIGQNTKKDYSEKIINSIQDLDKLNAADLIETDANKNSQQLFSKKSPIHYNWLMPNGKD